ncbi:hypothetical protein EV421DRAFT_1743022 [Armillaria borealis]|uniref:Uncharacterized protein n=1 Tax=Armillaria borealis TaxID=47425 RepID=A0AA39MEQ9_9AGAR|nr:hypothetical protein EV421DRAFT_1743022 [Armillaria borealis]
MSVEVRRFNIQYKTKDDLDQKLQGIRDTCQIDGLPKTQKLRRGKDGQIMVHYGSFDYHSWGKHKTHEIKRFFEDMDAGTTRSRDLGQWSTVSVLRSQCQQKKKSAKPGSAILFQVKDSPGLLAGQRYVVLGQNPLQIGEKCLMQPLTGEGVEVSDRDLRGVSTLERVCPIFYGCSPDGDTLGAAVSTRYCLGRVWWWRWWDVEWNPGGGRSRFRHFRGVTFTASSESFHATWTALPALPAMCFHLCSFIGRLHEALGRNARNTGSQSRDSRLDVKTSMIRKGKVMHGAVRMRHSTGTVSFRTSYALCEILSPGFTGTFLDHGPT